jgi:hypothetical protein
MTQFASTLTLTQNGRAEQVDAKISGDTLILSTAVPGGTAQLSFGK